MLLYMFLKYSLEPSRVFCPSFIMSRKTSVTTVTAIPKGNSCTTQSVYMNSLPINSSIYETVIKFIDPPSGVSIPPLFAPHTIASRISGATLLFSNRLVQQISAWTSQ